MTTQIKNTKELRKATRNKRWHGSTNGVCPGYVQTNLVILPEEFAFDFTVFCLRNPKACPILEILDPGDPKINEFAENADIRTDLPQYCIYQNGSLVEETDDIIGHWQKDVVSFLIGCSYTFEEALVSPHFSYAPLTGDNQGHPAAPSHRQVQNRHTHINRNAFD